MKRPSREELLRFRDEEEAPKPVKKIKNAEPVKSEMAILDTPPKKRTKKKVETKAKKVRASSIYKPWILK